MKKMSNVEAIKSANNSGKQFNAHYVKNAEIELETPAKFNQAKKAMDALAILAEAYRDVTHSAPIMENGKDTRADIIDCIKSMASVRLTNLYEAWGLPTNAMIMTEAVLSLALNGKVNKATKAREIAVRTGGTLYKDILAAVVRMYNVGAVSVDLVAVENKLKEEKPAKKPANKSTGSRKKYINLATFEAIVRASGKTADAIRESLKADGYYVKAA